MVANVVFVKMQIKNEIKSSYLHVVNRRAYVEMCTLFQEIRILFRHFRVCFLKVQVFLASEQQWGPFL